MGWSWGQRGGGWSGRQRRVNCFSACLASWHLPVPRRGSFPGRSGTPTQRSVSVSRSVHALGRSLLGLSVSLGAKCGGDGGAWTRRSCGALGGRDPAQEGRQAGPSGHALAATPGDAGWPSAHPQPAWDTAQQPCPQPRVCPGASGNFGKPFLHQSLLRASPSSQCTPAGPDRL